MLALLGLATGAPALRDIPPATLRGYAQAAAVTLTPAGLELEVDRSGGLIVPVPGAQALDLEVTASGTFTAVFAAVHGTQVTRQVLMRYRVIRPGRQAVRVNLRVLDGWDPQAVAVMRVSGSGRLAVARVRVEPAPPDAAAAEEALDRALRWDPLAVTPSTINALPSPWWSRVRDLFVPDLLGLLLLAGAGGGALALRLRRGRWAWRAPLAAATLAVVALWDAYHLARFLPAVAWSLPGSADQRVRDHSQMYARPAELAVLARRTLGEGTRVGVAAPPEDWVAAEAICFHLAPRPCVRFVPGEEVHQGLSGVVRLRTGELDALVWADDPRPLPAGFAPVAALTPHDLVARRVR